MREIKFRLRIGNEIIGYERWYKYWEHLKIGETDWYPAFLYAIDKDLFTGLRDKNGKEIYEGDIIKDKEDCNFSIVWDYHNCGFYLQSTEDDEYNMEMVYILNNKIEVIGNTYENPELLKGV